MPGIWEPVRRILGKFGRNGDSRANVPLLDQSIAEVPRGPLPAPEPPPQVEHKVRPADPLSEYVSSEGYVFLAAYIKALPPYIDDVSRDLGEDIYNRMLLDPQVFSSLRTIKLSILADGVNLVPAISDEDEPGYQESKAILEHAEHVLANLQRDVTEWLYEMLDALALGNRVAEQVYELDESGPYAGSLALRRLSTKPRRSTSFVVDAYHNCIGLLGLVPGSGAPILMGSIVGTPSRLPNLLPRSKFAVLTHGMIDNDPRGTSLLRAVYNPWQLKVQMWGEYLRYLTQFASPSLFATTPPGAQAMPPTDALGNPIPGAVAITPEQQLVTILMGLRNGSVAAAPHDTTLMPIDLRSAGDPFQAAFKLYDDQIAKGISGQTLATEEGAHQARAAAEVHQDVMGLGPQYLKGTVASMLYRDVLRPWVRYNYGERASLLFTPKAVLGKLDLNTWAPHAQAAASIGYQLDPSQLPAMDERFGLPVRSEQAVAQQQAGAQRTETDAEPDEQQLGQDGPPARPKLGSGAGGGAVEFGAIIDDATAFDPASSAPPNLDAHALAEMYAESFNDQEEAGVGVRDDDLQAADEELAGSGWVVDRDEEAGRWIVYQVEEEASFSRSLSPAAERVKLISEILVILYGDRAPKVAKALYARERSNTGSADFAQVIPKGARAFKTPPPGWTVAHTGPRGGKYYARPARAPKVAPATPPPSPAPTAPAPTAAPGQTAYAKRRAATSAVHADAIAKLAFGGLTPAERSAVANKLTSMSSPELKSLHAALGGSAAITGPKARLARNVRSILSSGAPAAPVPPPTPPLPTPPAPPTPATPGPAPAPAPAPPAPSARAARAAAHAALMAAAQAGRSPPPSPAPPAPSVLNKGANVITGKPAGGAPAPSSTGPPGPPPRPGLVWDATSHRWTRPDGTPDVPPAPAYYQPPAPNLLLKVGPYAGKTNSSGLPVTIDHTMVAGFISAPSSLPASYTVNATPTRGFAEYDHTTSGYKVIADWKYTGLPVPPGQTRSYVISILDGSGKLVSSYDSSAARDETYIKGRAVQVAGWLDGELKKLSAQKSQPTSAPLAQFAWDYAQAAGIKPGTVPFDVSGNDPKERAKIEGYLKAEFPKLIGAKQHAPHGGMDTVEHTMNIVNPANLRTAGLPQRDAELLKLGMIFHDVGKQYDALDHDHPRKSATDAEPLLWQFGLSPREVSDTLAVIKWHDAYGDAMKAGSGPKEAEKVAKIAYEYADDKLPDADRWKEAHRINNLLMRAWQSDLSSIPGLTADPIPGRPDLKVSGFIHVDKAGPVFEKKVGDAIDNLTKSQRPASAPLPKKPLTASVGVARPDLVAPGLKWGELVQRTDAIPVGEPVKYDSTVVPPKEVYDEAHKNPGLNYARAFNMGYDGPTGKIVTAFHGTSSSHNAGILSTGLRAGSNGDNVYGHGVYVFANGADEMTSTYAQDSIVGMEVHTGRMIDHDDLVKNVVPKWKKAVGAAEYANMASKGVNAHLTAAALWAGYSTIAQKYYSNEPILIVLDPSRIRTNTIVGSRGRGYKGADVSTPAGKVKFADLPSDEKKIPQGSPGHLPTKHHVPQGFSGQPRTS